MNKKISSKLITTTDQTVKGFALQASMKIDLSRDYIDNVNKVLKLKFNSESNKNLMNDKFFYDFIVGACCLSKKSINHIELNEQLKIFKELIDFNKLNENDYIMNLVYRYLLTSGDSMGGSIRNLVGQSAQQLFTQKILDRLQKMKIKFSTKKSNKEKVISIKFSNKEIIFDKKPKFIDKSIDFIVLKDHCDLEDPKSYVACGELKGGIDPAGADEHWKTAKSALDRINVAFKNKNVSKPKLFFVGSAIQVAMAAEIEDLLENKWLSGAANLNNKEQVENIINLLIKD